MVWSCLTVAETGSFVRTHGIMNQEVYKKLLVTPAKPALQQFGSAIFQQDNDSKHTAKLVLNYLNSQRWPDNLMDWPPQISDLNPI